jgi:hypothetical protein
MPTRSNVKTEEWVNGEIKIKIIFPYPEVKKFNTWLILISF